jgi:hypothetical protein
MSRSGWKADIPSQRFEKPVEPLVLVANLTLAECQSKEVDWSSLKEKRRYHAAICQINGEWRCGKDARLHYR